VNYHHYYLFIPFYSPDISLRPGEIYGQLIKHGSSSRIENEYTNNEAEEQAGFSSLDHLFEDYEDLEFMTRKLIEEYTK